MVRGHRPEVKKLVPDFLVDANMIVGLFIQGMLELGEEAMTQ